MDDDLIRKIRQADKWIGYKQTARALEEETCREVLVAADADEHILMSVIPLCQSRGVPFTIAGHKKEIGALCGIDVAAAVVGFRSAADREDPAAGANEGRTRNKKR